jgi:hypothetical protein
MVQVHSLGAVLQRGQVAACRRRGRWPGPGPGPEPVAANPGIRTKNRLVSSSRDRPLSSVDVAVSTISTRLSRGFSRFSTEEAARGYFESLGIRRMEGKRLTLRPPKGPRVL